MGRNVEIHDTPPIVADDEEAIEHTEGDGRNGKEVHRRDGFPVISKQGKPAFCWPRVSRRSFHPAGNRSFRDIETEHEKFAVNTWGAPGGVLRDHPKDQIADLLRSPSPAHYSAAVLMIQTNATDFASGRTNIIDGSVATVDTFEPTGRTVTPEPSSVVLFGTGLLTAAGALRRRLLS